MKKILFTIPLFCLILFSCTESNQQKKSIAEMEKLKVENDSLKNYIEATAKNRIITSLTFQDNNAENAMNFYVGLFDNSKIINLQRWGKDAPVEEGRIMQATFELDGNLFMCSDNPPIHNWDFTPAVSNYIECDTREKMEKLFSKLSENGKVTMPLDNYGFSQRFGWVIDQFGVSWQLNMK